MHHAPMQVVSTSELCVTKGTLLHTLAARAIIRDWEEGVVTDAPTVDAYHHELRKQDMINLSIEYQVVTKATSFVAVEERVADDAHGATPDVEQLAHGFNVDVLPAQGWTEPPWSTAEHAIHAWQACERTLYDVDPNNTHATSVVKNALNALVTALSPTHPRVLEAALQLGEHLSESGSEDGAVAVLKDAFDTALSTLDTLSEESYKESTAGMQRIRDRLTVLTDDTGKSTSCFWQPSILDSGWFLDPHGVSKNVCAVQTCCI